MIDDQLYSNDLIVKSAPKQEPLAQLKPHHVCQKRGHYDAMSKRLGYKCRCRDPRCSIRCLKAFLDQERAVLQYVLEDLGDGYRTFGGSLTLPPNAAKEDHKKARSNFLRALSRWKRSSGKEVQIRAICDFGSGKSDAQNKANMHYDFVMYVTADVGIERVRKLIADSWEQAGGLRSSCLPLDESEEQGWAVYQTKTRKADANRYRYVPVKGGLPFTFQSWGFFGKGQSRASTWKAWIAAHFPKMMVLELVDAPPRPITTNKTTSQSEAVREDVPTSSQTDDLETDRYGRPITIDKTTSQSEAPILLWHGRPWTASRAEFEADSPLGRWATEMSIKHPDMVRLRERARPVYQPPDYAAEIRRAMPTSPESAIGPQELAESLGLDLDVTFRHLRKLPGVQWLPGNSYYLGRPPTPPEAPQEPRQEEMTTVEFISLLDRILDAG